MYTVKNRSKRSVRGGRSREARGEHHNASEANWPGPRSREAGGIERGPAVAGACCAGGCRGHRAPLPRDVRRAVSDGNERRRHASAEQRARHGYAPAPQASRESRQPWHVTSGPIFRRFLVRGDGPQDWRLEGRTWGAPAPESVHGWHLVAADAARLLDPTVPVPSRLDHWFLTTTRGHTGRRSRRRRRRWRRP
jgi:hypothetical protein